MFFDDDSQLKKKLANFLTAIDERHRFLAVVVMMMFGIVAYSCSNMGSSIQLIVSIALSVLALVPIHASNENVNLQAEKSFLKKFQVYVVVMIAPMFVIMPVFRSPVNTVASFIIAWMMNPNFPHEPWHTPTPSLFVKSGQFLISSALFYLGGITISYLITVAIRKVYQRGIKA